jgi:predicted heme/steroid binding protein
MRIFKDDYAPLNFPIMVDISGEVYDALNDFLWKAHEHGIFDSQKSLYERLNTPKKEEPPSPQVYVTMYMLSAGFIVWFIAVLIACLTFIGERTFQSMLYVRRFRSRRVVIV